MPLPSERNAVRGWKPSRIPLEHTYRRGTVPDTDPDPRDRSLPFPWLYHLCKTPRPLTRWFWQVRVLGLENLPRTGPVILASNHASYLDPWFLGIHMPDRNFRYLLNATWYGRSPLWKWVFDRCGVIPIAPGDSRETCRRVLRVLAGDGAVCIFPEGRISGNGRLHRGRPGIGYMAAMSGAPVVPCGLRGNFEALPRHRRIPRRHPIRIRLGEPMTFPGSPTDQPERYDVAVFIEGLMERIRLLSGAEVQKPSRSAR